MIANRFRTPGSIVLAAILILAAGYVAWIAVRTTATLMLSNGAAQVTPIVRQQPEYVLAAAMGSFVRDRARVQPRLLPGIRAAAIRMPLDERPYLFLGSTYLWERRDALALETLEAGRRLNPRQRWIHILLLDRYLRRGSYPLAAAELSVLARLVGGAQSPIAGALAQMAIAPETRDAVRRTLQQDVGLERSVLSALAGGNVEPATIFAMASPRALVGAGAADGWGTVLIERLVAKQRYRAAHAVWRRINGLSDRQAGQLLFNAGLDQLSAKAPFNWVLASNNVAAVDLRGNRLDVNYYGRDTGDLASQLLLLAPGNYRFGFSFSGVQQNAASRLVWSVTCADRPDRSLTSIELPESGSARRRGSFGFVVPADCPAQWLRLVGQAGEFPSPVSASIDSLQLQKAGQ